MYIVLYFLFIVEGEEKQLTLNLNVVISDIIPNILYGYNCSNLLGRLPMLTDFGFPTKYGFGFEYKNQTQWVYMDLMALHGPISNGSTWTQTWWVLRASNKNWIIGAKVLGLNSV
jgi:hypothetical protein